MQGFLILPSLPRRGPGPRQEALLTPGPVPSSEAFPSSGQPPVVPAYPSGCLAPTEDGSLCVVCSPDWEQRVRRGYTQCLAGPLSGAHGSFSLGCISPHWPCGAE